MELKLEKHLEKAGIRSVDLAKDLGKSRQIVDYWVKVGAIATVKKGRVTDIEIPGKRVYSEGRK